MTECKELPDGQVIAIGNERITKCTYDADGTIRKSPGDQTLTCGIGMFKL